MKISIVTATYNRAAMLTRLYRSILENSNQHADIEWLIMDDGSETSIEPLVLTWQQEAKFPISLFRQENKGKMAALNALIPKTVGDIIIEMDDDDYFVPNIFIQIILDYQKIVHQERVAGIIYEKEFPKNNRKMKTSLVGLIRTLYDLHYKEKLDFDMALVFKGDYRRKFHHELEDGEKFVTEARMYYKMDQGMDGFLIRGIPIMICEYQEDGYTKGNIALFKNNPHGYYAFFREVFSYSQKGILFSKRLYNIKHFILFGYLSSQKFREMKKYPRGLNKILFLILYLPGRMVSKKRFGDGR